jgi:hypothetical protein
MEKSQTFVACVKPSVRATIRGIGLGGRGETVACSSPTRFAIFVHRCWWMQVGTDAPPEELQQQRMVLAQANELERKKVDQVFTERNGWDTKTKDIDHQVPSNPIHVNAQL